MEEDDDFGDLYSDVLRPFQSPPPPPAAAAQLKPQIDLNLNSDGEEILYGAPTPNPNPNSDQLISPIKFESPPIKPDSASSSVIRWNLNLNVKQEDQGVKREKEESVIDEKINKNDPFVDKESVVEEKEDFGKFDIEEEKEDFGDMGTDALISGLPKREKQEEGDDWDSDSEDDLQIVLDDDKNLGMMGMNAGMDGEDEDGDQMVILTEPGMEEREWGEGGMVGEDGERKDGGEGAKAAMKIGFSSHQYHPYHSQFKYVRPGAAPIPGGAPVGPGGAPGQIRPLVGPVAGRGRGEWRPPGAKGFHSGFAWGSNTSGRGFGIGLDFTLPSHKTIFEVDVNSFEEKPWKLAGIDVSDFFNFGLNEESWKDYCKNLELLRMETSMHGKIRVYESGRAEQEYDPDLPPELAAATNVKEMSSENANVVKIDSGQGDVAKEIVNIRPSLPTGRPIQVETGSGERLPSIDTRPPRIRDSDAIIEIVLEGLDNEDPLAEDEAVEKPEQDLSREGSVGGAQSVENFVEENNKPFVGDSRTYNSKKRDDLSEGDDTEPQVAQTRRSPSSRARSSSFPDKDVTGDVNEERRTKSRTRDRSPDITRSGSTLPKRESKEGSVESVDAKRRPNISPPNISNGSDEELDVERIDDSHDDVSRYRGERVSDTTPSPTSSKKKRGSSRVPQSSPQNFDDGGESRKVKNVENRKTRSGSERDYNNNNARGSVEEDAIRHGRGKVQGNMKRSYDDDEHFSKNRNYGERNDMGKHRLVETSREDPYSYRDWDPHVRKERENPRKRALVEETGSRHRNKVHESERMEKDEYFKPKKHMDNGSSRVYYEKELGSQYRGRDDNIKNRFENVDDPYRKRRKEDEFMRRDIEKEEIFMGRREFNNHRKREREDGMDPRKREGGVRNREEGHQSNRYKDEEWVLWERERHRGKQTHEESLPKRERVEGREKTWVGQGRGKDKGLEREYQYKEMGRQSEQLKRRGEDRVEDNSFSHYKGNEDGYSDERRSKQERHDTRGDIENSRSHHKKYKESSRKGKEFEGGERNSVASSKRNQEERNGQIKEPVSEKYKVDVTGSSDEEQQDSRKGRSKLERWTSHQERDFTIPPKKSSSTLLAVKEIEKYNNIVEPALPTKSPEENHNSSDAPKEANDAENKDAEPKPVENNNNNKHLDTVEKLKKRSERFKLPMPSEKEAVVIKKMENENSPTAQDEAPIALEIKPERPARKRRWISS